MRYILLVLLLVSCGTYHHSSQQIKSVLAITEKGDTIAVPYDKIYNRERYDIINTNIWNRRIYPYEWGFFNQWGFIPIYGNFNSRSFTNSRVVPKSRVRPKPQPQPRPRQPRVNPPRVQSTPNVIQRTNVGRRSTSGNRKNN